MRDGEWLSERMERGSPADLPWGDIGENELQLQHQFPQLRPHYREDIEIQQERAFGEFRHYIKLEQQNCSQKGTVEEGRVAISSSQQLRSSQHHDGGSSPGSECVEEVRGADSHGADDQQWIGDVPFQESPPCIQLLEPHESGHVIRFEQIVFMGSKDWLCHQLPRGLFPELRPEIVVRESQDDSYDTEGQCKDVP